MLGLSKNATRVYLEAMESPGKTPDFFAENLGLSVHQVIDAHRELIGNDLALSNVDSVEIIPPDRAAELIVLRQESELIAHQVRLSECRIRAERMKAASYKIVPLGTETVYGASEIWDRLQGLASEARISMDTLSPSGALNETAIAFSQANDKDTYERGVEARTIYLDSARNDHKTLEHLHWLAEVGAQVRTAPKLPIRMIIVDKQIVVLPINLENGMDGLVLFRSPVIVKPLQQLFELTWAAAKPLGFSPGPKAAGLTDYEKTILKMIAKGKSDIEIAEKLQVSERTVRRNLKEAMDRLKAKTRPEAIYKATKNGWI